MRDSSNKICKRTLTTQLGEKHKMNYKLRNSAGTGLPILHANNFVQYYEKSWTGTQQELKEWRTGYLDFMGSSYTLAELRKAWKRRIQVEETPDGEEQEQDDDIDDNL